MSATTGQGGWPNLVNRRIDFVGEEFLRGLGSLTKEEADACDFGVVKLDDSGTIELYNAYESDLGGVPQDAAEGKSFFMQIAPCTNNGLFHGVFKRGVAAKLLDVSFKYTFTFKMNPVNVHVHLYRHADSGTNWVFVRRA